MNILELIFGDLNKKEIKKLEKIAVKVEDRAEEMKALSDDELRGKTEEFRKRFKEGESLDSLLPEAFAVAREGATRALHMTPYHVQILGGIALHQGRIAEQRTGEGKHVPYDTPMPTPNGWKKAKDIKLGDYLFDIHGNPTRVIGVFPQGTKETYQITLKDGRTVKCGDKHLWEVYDGYSATETATLSTEEMLSNYEDIKRGYRYHLPTAEAVKYPEQNLPIPPYVMGVFLGNGCKNQNGKFELSSGDYETVDRISEILNATPNKHKGCYSWTFKQNGKVVKISDFAPQYKDLLSQMYSFEKYIPKEYLCSSIEQRWELIRGLMDSDGNIHEEKDKKRYKLSYSTTSRKLRDGIMEVIYSLGFSCSSRKGKKAGEGTARHDQYEVSINVPNSVKDSFFKLTRKKKIAKRAANYKKRKDYSRVAITKIEKLDYSCEQVCFAVDNQEHLFLVGEYVVTHNTLVATLPTYLNAITGEGVHVITVNDYLAKRDSEWMGKLYNFLGLTVGCLTNDTTKKDRYKAYRCDITYGTNSEFGFDYLRDNMAVDEGSVLQRPLNYAIVDEVDSVLIDEARTPLIISGQKDDSTEMYRHADSFVKSLAADDFELDEKEKGISLTDTGVRKAEQFFDIENYSDPGNIEINHYVQQALKANHIMKRDVDYVVKDGEIMIVDEFTGRIMPGRRYGHGLHQAIEAKEGVEIQRETNTLATITIQNYFRMYKKLAGMTGTAKTEEDEFREIYNMDVVVIPPNKPVIRQDLEDQVYQTEKAKFKAVSEKIQEIHDTGRPVLVGTISVEKSEYLSDLLTKKGIKHSVLNAKQHEKEAEIVAQAGKLNQVTIATNMAGRGTDILLGGNPEFEAKKEMRKDGFSDEEISFATGYARSEDESLLKAREAYRKYYKKFKMHTDYEHDRVVELGGLAILGTERHESRRIDNQLRGRSGRQGDPGTSQFYISLEDNLIRLFGGDRIKNVTGKIGLDENEVIEMSMLTKSIENAQKTVEGRNFGIRKYVLQYDNVMNKQREQIYKDRNKVLHGENIRNDIMNMMRALVKRTVEPYTLVSKDPREWDYEHITEKLRMISPNYEPLEYDEEYLKRITPEEYIEGITDEFEDIYIDKEREIGESDMRALERAILLKVVDTLWIDHLDAMEQLEDGIGLRAIGQEDPTAAYAREGFEMFNALNREITEETVKYCYHAVRVEPENI